MNLSSHVPASCSTAKIPIASKSLGILTATGKPESRMRRNSKSDAASSSQVKLKDAYIGGLMSEVRGSSGETCCLQNSCRKPGAVSKSENSGHLKAERKEWPHNLHVSPVHHMEAESSRSSGKSTNKDQMILWMTWT